METSQSEITATPVEGKPPPSTQTPIGGWRGWFKRPGVRVGLALSILGLAYVAQSNLETATMSQGLQTFVTIFLGIFIEAVPFLVAGSIVSGFIEVFVNRDMLFRFIPKNPILASLMGGSLGMVFPVCECGVVPVTRRLYQKGLPISMGIAFLLAAPVVNPVVLASTYAAFGWGPMLWGRFVLSFFIASFIGFLFYFARPDKVLLDTSQDHHHSDHDDHAHCATPSPQAVGIVAQQVDPQQIWHAMRFAADDFLDMARYLVAGSMLAATMQTIVPQPVLLALGAGTITSVLAMMALAFILSICSTVDAFLALAFINTFTPASVLAFLTFGPMVDIKSALMFLSVFRRRIVLYLIALPLVINLVVAIYLNLNVAW